MIPKFRILYWIGLLLCVVWWGVLYYWRDGILGKIESLYGARSIYSYAWALAWLMPTTPLLLGVVAVGFHYDLLDSPIAILQEAEPRPEPLTTPWKWTTICTGVGKRKILTVDLDQALTVFETMMR